MRDGILRAAVASSTTNENRGGKFGDSLNNTEDIVAAPPPIAPLPTRLSFCLPGTSSKVMTPCSPKQTIATTNCNESRICEAFDVVAEEPILASSDHAMAKKVKSPLKVLSPVKSLVAQSLVKSERTGDIHDQVPLLI